jgi:hypothetical protein
MHIHCFGASVTAQSVTRNGVKNGYVDFLSDMCKTNHVKVTRSAFGSCQFYNMGKFAFNSCLEGHPDILMFDWHTTGESNHSISQWVSIIRTCLLKGTLPVILILPRRDIDISLQKYSILDLLNSISLVIDLSSLRDYDVILRDVVHTTEKGSLTYAHLVWDDIKSIAVNRDILLKQISVYTSALASFSDYECSVHYSCHPMPAYASYLDQTYRLIVGLSSPSDVGVWGTKDFQVGDIKIWEPFKKKSAIYHVFDQWCYYARDSLLLTHSASSNVNIIEIALSSPLYSLLCPKLDLSTSASKQRLGTLNIIKRLYVKSDVDVSIALCKK